MRGFILVVLLLGAATVNAETPFYVGGGLGILSYDDGADIDTRDLSGESFGYQIFTGWEITPRWAVEVGYSDLGSIEDAVDFPLFLKTTVDTYVVYANVQYHIPLGDSASLDLSPGYGWGEAEATKEPWAADGTPVIGATEKVTDNDSGFILNVGLTMKVTDAIYVRPVFSYYGFNWDDNTGEEVVDKPWRLGVDVIWDF